jgi:[acyl-carrier-protein] S-malonyltransferase
MVLFLHRRAVLAQPQRLVTGGRVTTPTSDAQPRETAPGSEGPSLDELQGVAVVFPGQGTQTLGMAGKILELHPAAKDRFEQANDVLGYDLLKLVEEGPVDALDDTFHSQPAIYVTSMAWLDALRARWAQTDRPFDPIAMAGHSMGQISAAAAAGALDYESGLRLVQERGRAMQAADRTRPGGMASIIGLRDRVLKAIVGAAVHDDTLVVANDNGPGHAVVSGDEGALQRVMHLAELEGARRVVRLKISIASHSPLMREAQEEFRQAVKAMPWRDPDVPMISNATAGFLLTRDAIAEELDHALLRPVDWRSSVKTMAGHGANLFVEPGPGDVLSKLVRRISKRSWTFPTADEGAGLARRDYPDLSDGIPK